MEPTILEKAKYWATSEEFDAVHREEIQKLIDAKDEKAEKELTERFYRDLEFGTGGLRSIIGIGPNRINVYTIRRASQALANAVKENNPGGSIAISYDSRNFSFEFAKTAAGVFAANGLKVWIYKTLNPVALLSYAVRELKCSAGIMVTASHNPPEYNGYKVFNEHGAQVIPPLDGKIISQYNGLADFSKIPFVDFDEAMNEKKIEWISDEIEQGYYTNVVESIVTDKELCDSKGKDLNIVYTAIHGTGLEPCSKILKAAGFTSLKTVAEQDAPNGNFPTVTSPNPENPEALELAVKLMKETNSDLVFGSDPDTDRLGVAFIKDGEVKYLNGNQIGHLKLFYLLEKKKANGTLGTNSFFVNTIVTSPLQERIADEYGVKTYKTLTGFKWICGKMNEVFSENSNADFLFATEESFGYLNHPYIRDKDGVSAVVHMAEVALWLKERGMDLQDGLDEISNRFGFAEESLVNKVYQGKEGAEKIQRLMGFFRNDLGQELAGIGITDKLDLLNEGTGYPKSNVLGFKLQDGNQLFVRPSGTEPKIKFYVMIQATEGNLDQKKALAQEKTETIIRFIDQVCEKV
ncbi:MAG: phospho-sugar mutase [Bacteriovoracaceae bacterium]